MARFGRTFPITARYLKPPLQPSAGNNFTLFPADTITLSDSVAKAIGLSKSDTITLSDTKVIAVGLFKNDTITLSDSVVKTVGLKKADTISLSDAVIKAIGKPQSDTITLSDAIAKAVHKFFSDTITLSDSMNAVILLLIQLADTIDLQSSTASAVKKLVGLRKDDVLSLSDSQLRAIAKILADVITLSDVIDVQLITAFRSVATAEKIIILEDKEFDIPMQSNAEGLTLEPMIGDITVEPKEADLVLQSNSDNIDLEAVDGN